MSRPAQWSLQLIALALCLAGSGCAPLRLPAVDPTGTRLFLPHPNSTQVVLHPSEWKLKWPEPAFVEPPDPEDCPTPPPAPPVAELASAAPGAATTAGGDDLELPMLGGWRSSWFRRTLHPMQPNARVSLSPGVMTVPVGSEVVLVGSVVDGDASMRPGEPIEWLLGAGSVGSLLDLNLPEYPLVHSVLRGPVGGKVDHRYAVGETLSRPLLLDRGTVETADDIQLQRGQSWITLTSATEGSSQVTFFAPEVPDWRLRQQTALIHWVDAQWTFPPPAFNGGSEVDISTLVTRRSDGGPAPNWIVRYEVLGGAPATLSATEVVTDGTGRAAVRVTPQLSGQGATQIGIQVIRPGRGPGQPDRLVLAQASTVVTWSSAQLGLVVEPLQQQVEMGQGVSYRVTVTNHGSAASEDVIVRSTLGTGTRVIQSTPVNEGFHPDVYWRLGQLQPGQSQAIQVTLDVDRPGAATFCASAQSGAIVVAQQCATTQVVSRPLDVAISGAASAVVGQRLVFDITVTNLTGQPLSDVVVRDYFDAGLRSNLGGSPLERRIPVLAAGQSQTFPVGFDVIQAGRQCQRVEVSHASGGMAQAEKCLEVVEAARPAVRISITTDRMTLTASEILRAALVVENSGSTDLHGLQVVDQFDQPLQLVRASDGYRQDLNQLIWTIPTLPAGGRMTFEIWSRAASASASVCHRVQVTSDEGAQAADQVCVEITQPTAPPPAASPGGFGSQPGVIAPPDSGLGGAPSLPPADTTGPPPSARGLEASINLRPQSVTLRQEVELTITIQNWSDSVYRDVTPRLILPEGVRFVGAQSPAASPPRFGQSDRELVFETTAVVRPRERALTFLVRVIPQTAGTFDFRLEVDSPDLSPSLQATRSLQVFGAP